MNVNDITTKKVRSQTSGSFSPIFERDWLEYLGYTKDELASGEIEMVFKAEVSDHKKFRYIGVGRPKKVI